MTMHQYIILAMLCFFQIRPHGATWVILLRPIFLCCTTPNHKLLCWCVLAIHLFLQYQLRSGNCYIDGELFSNTHTPPAVYGRRLVSAGVVVVRLLLLPVVSEFLCLDHDLLLLPIRVVGPNLLHYVRQAAEACNKTTGVIMRPSYTDRITRLARPSVRLSVRLSRAGS